jgi:hypothetical protein
MTKKVAAAGAQLNKTIEAWVAVEDERGRERGIGGGAMQISRSSDRKSLEKRAGH